MQKLNNKLKIEEVKNLQKRINQKHFLEKEYSNGQKIVRITESSLNRINHHIKDSSFIIISAFTQFNTKKENLERTNKLKKILQKKHLSYVPVYGGYKMKNGDFSYESSFIVFNVQGNTEDVLIMSPEELREFGLTLIQNALGQTLEKGFKTRAEKVDVECFGQESFLFKEVGKPAELIFQNGSKVEVGEALTFNDVLQQFFTALNKRNHNKKSDKYFTIKESYINAPARIITIGMFRAYTGEIFELDI